MLVVALRPAFAVALPVTAPLLRRGPITRHEAMAPTDRLPTISNPVVPGPLGNGATTDPYVAVAVPGPIPGCIDISTARRRHGLDDRNRGRNADFYVHVDARKPGTRS